MAHVDMHLSTAERSSLDRVSIDRDLPQFDAYGVVGDELKQQLTGHLSGMGENDPTDVERIAETIHRLAVGMQNGFGKEAAWITVRVSVPNPAFDVPRWHPDGAYYATAENEKTYKLVAALKGAQTLFGKVRDGEVYQQLENAEHENQRKNENDSETFEAEKLRIRYELVKIIEPMNPPASEQATVYRVGDKQAVIHSEPPIAEPRIFVSVLPGSREQIEEWQSRPE